MVAMVDGVSTLKWFVSPEFTVGIGAGGLMQNSESNVVNQEKQLAAIRRIIL